LRLSIDTVALSKIGLSLTTGYASIESEPVPALSHLPSTARYASPFARRRETLTSYYECQVRDSCLDRRATLRLSLPRTNSPDTIQSPRGSSTVCNPFLFHLEQCCILIFNSVVLVAFKIDLIVFRSLPVHSQPDTLSVFLIFDASACANSVGMARGGRRMDHLLVVHMTKVDG
jgi:hypothetical protein